MNLKFEEKIIRKTVKRRLKKTLGLTIKNNHLDCSIFMQMDKEQFAKLLKAKKDSGISFSEDNKNIRDYGYTDGLIYANKLINEDNYNLSSLLEALNLIPNSCAFLTLGTSYALGFFEGIFGKRGIEHNFFIKKWRKILVTEFH